MLLCLKKKNCLGCDLPNDGHRKLLIVPTFDTKVTEYLCSGWFFFFRRISAFYLAIFDGIFLYHSKGIVVLSSNLKKKCYDCLLRFMEQQ